MTLEDQDTTDRIYAHFKARLIGKKGAAELLEADGEDPDEAKRIVQEWADYLSHDGGYGDDDA